MQYNNCVQLQHPVLKRQGEVESRYNVLLGPAPITMWYKVTMRNTALNLVEKLSPPC